jgi:protein BCP1
MSPKHARRHGAPPEAAEDEARRKKQKAAVVDEEDEEDGSSAPEVSTSEDDDDDDGTSSGATSSEDDDDESDDPSSSSSSSDEEDDEDDEHDGKRKKKKELQVDFRFFEPAERDFHGLRALLGSYLDGQGYDVGGLVDAVIAQGAKGDGVGTVVRAIDATAADGGNKAGGKKANDDDDDADDPADPIAVVTAVGLEGYRAAPFASGVRDFVLARAERAGKRAAFEAAWGAPRAALLLNERLVNCPPQIAPPMVQYLFEEIERARVEEAEELAELEAAARASGGAAPPPPSAPPAACGYAFDRYVLLTRVYEDPQDQEDEEEDDEEDDEPGEKKKKKRKKQKKDSKQSKAGGGGGGGLKKAPPAVLVYTRPEDRFFHARSTAAFTFPVEGRPVARGELRPLRLALVLPASEVAAARRELDRAVGNARAMPPPPPIPPRGAAAGQKKQAGGGN